MMARPPRNFTGDRHLGIVKAATSYIGHSRRGVAACFSPYPVPLAPLLSSESALDAQFRPKP